MVFFLLPLIFMLLMTIQSNVYKHINRQQK